MGTHFNLTVLLILISMVDHSPEFKIKHHSSVVGERFPIFNLISMARSGSGYLRKVSHCFSWTHPNPGGQSKHREATEHLTLGEHRSGQEGSALTDTATQLIHGTSACLPLHPLLLTREKPELSSGFQSWDGLSLIIENHYFLDNEVPRSSLFYSCFCFSFIIFKDHEWYHLINCGWQEQILRMDNHDHFGSDLWQNMGNSACNSEVSVPWRSGGKQSIE